MSGLSQTLSHLPERGEFSFTVSEFSQLDGTRLSDKLRVDGFLWRMMVLRKEQSGSSQGGKLKPLGVYLQRTPEPNKSSGDETPTRAVITLVNQENPDKSYSKEFTHNYSNSSTDWGFPSFIKLRDLTNPSKGFIVNDTIIFKAEINVNVQPLEQESHVEQTQKNCVPTHQNSVLACPSCDTDYECQGARQPMSLRCGHTFCSECLDKKCSTSDLTMKITCTMCLQEHLGGSSRELWFPNHSVIQMIGNVIPKSKYFCDTHKQNMDYYCFVDYCLVCIGCAYQGKHAGHLCKLVSEARTEVENQLRIANKKVVSKSTEVSRKLELLKDEQRSVQSQEDTLVHAVEKSYKQLEEVIKRQKDSQLKELREHMEELNSSINTRIRFTEKKNSQVQNTLSEFKAWQSLSTKDALQKAATMKAALEATMSMSIDTEASVPPQTSLSFTRPMSELFAAIESQGRIDGDSSGSQGRLENSSTVSSQSDLNERNGIDTHMPPNKRKKLAQ